MTRFAVSSLVLALVVATSTVAAQSDPISQGQPDQGRRERDPKIDRDMGMSAPLVSVDRFSDAAGSIFRRSADPTLPGPNIPFSLDDPPFRVEVARADGTTARCYDLDARPAKPNRFYVFYDSLNNYRLGQFPVIEKVPGDPGYSDLWDIWKVTTPDAFYETNWVRDAAALEKLLADPASGFTSRSTGIYLNAPIVPEGTTASLKAEGRSGGATQRYFAWYRGRRAPYLYFEGSLHLAPDGTIPVAELDFTAGGPGGPKAVARASSWPKAPGYSPLVRVTGARGRPTMEGFINCPIVGTSEGSPHN